MPDIMQRVGASGQYAALPLIQNNVRARPQHLLDRVRRPFDCVSLPALPLTNRLHLHLLEPAPSSAANAATQVSWRRPRGCAITDDSHDNSRRLTAPGPVRW